MSGQTTGIDWRGTMTPDGWQMREHRTTVALNGKSLVITDNHQYAILAWRDIAAKAGVPPVLVSIDYHPDTDPPFYFVSVGKAAAKDPTRLDALTSAYEKRFLARARADLVAVMPQMNNDEQINTAMALGIISDYHMINCMAPHVLETGTHYLTAHDGDLSDAMFFRCGAAKALRRLADGETPFILDIDLDYFPGNTFDTAGPLMKALVMGAAGLTMARSPSYFDKLRKDAAFSLQTCEARAVACIKKLDGVV